MTNKFRNQKIKIYLYLPEGTLLKPDASVNRFTRNYNTNLSLFDSYDENDNRNYSYKVTKSELNCLNCPVILRDENGEIIENAAENDSTSTTVTIDDKGVRIQKGSEKNENREFKGLEVNKDGIIIKTKKS